LNEAKSLLAVEPLYGSLWHVAFLSLRLCTGSRLLRPRSCVA
jgi:hypothetical protein